MVYVNSFTYDTGPAKNRMHPCPQKEQLQHGWAAWMGSMARDSVLTTQSCICMVSHVHSNLQGILLSDMCETASLASFLGSPYFFKHIFKYI